MNPKATWSNYCLPVVCLALLALRPGSLLAQPTITLQPTNQAVAVGQNGFLTVAVSGDGPFTFQWRCNGTNLPANIISTVAGNGTRGFSGDGGPATNAAFYGLEGVAVDAWGNLYLADSGNHRVRRVASNGVITTVAGLGSPGFSGDGQAATNACLRFPYDVAVDGSGNLFIADTDNDRIRKVDAQGMITTVAGVGTSGFSGDGGAATNASLLVPCGVSLDAAGNLYIADTANYRIRRVDTNGIISTLAGGGSGGDGGDATNASLLSPYRAVYDPAAGLFIADTAHNEVRRVDSAGTISRFAGTGVLGYSGDGGAATNAGLYNPNGLALDACGNLFIADLYNQRVRMVDLNGVITSVVGTGNGGYYGDGGAATNARIINPTGLAFDCAGNLFVACGDGHVRRVNSAGTGYPGLMLYNVATNNAGDYSVIVSNASGCVTSSVATLFVGYAPSIVAQPMSQGMLVGNSALFNATVSGTPPVNCLWFCNATNLLQAGTNTALALTAVSPADSGNYTLVASNAWGMVTSAVATLTVALPPVLTSPPLSQSAWPGSNLSFTATAEGTPPLCYHWMHQGTFVPNYFISTVAGTGSVLGDGGPATNASVVGPTGVAFDALGNLFIADRSHNRIRKVDVGGLITTVAGNDVFGYSGDGGPGTNASLALPQAVACDGAGNLYIADSGNGRIRKVDVNGLITTIAGGRGSGYSGDGGWATNASLSYPGGLAVGPSGALYFADVANSRIRKISPAGLITTVAGGGTGGDGGWATNASLSLGYTPSGTGGLAFDAQGNLFIADTEHYRVRQVTTNGIILTVAGCGSSGFAGDGGLAGIARLSLPLGLAVDAWGNLFIVDANRIRMVAPSGMITTVAGTNSYGNSGDGGPAIYARLNTPVGLATDGAGDVFVADSYNSRIRKLTGTPSLLLSNVSLADLGDYCLVVSNPWASVTSSVVTLTLEGPPVILTGPAAQDALPGGSASFAVTAAGTPPLGYAWLFNGTNVIPDATDAQLTLTGVSVANAGTYAAVVTNLYGSSTSAPAVLAVEVIATQPASQTVCAGDSVTLRVATLGTGPFTYQWQLNGTNLPNNIIRTVAGSTSYFGFGDGGPATKAYLNTPYDVAADAVGNLYIADSQDGCVRKVDLNGMISTVSSRVGFPTGVAPDPGGNLYVADYYGNIIYKLGTNGVRSVVAGGGRGGDWGPAVSAGLNHPETIALDASGNLYFTDNMHQSVRKVDTNGIITTVAGTGSVGFSGDGGLATQATFDGPTGIALDAAGNLFVTDFWNFRIRKVDARDIITTVVGTGEPHWGGGYGGDGGLATNALLYCPTDVAFDRLGNMYIADCFNSRIRKVDTQGIITTVAGVPHPGPLGDGGPATAATLSGPEGIGLDSSGNLYIADTGNNRIREVPFGGHPTLTFDSVGRTNAGDYSVIISSPRGSMTSAVATLTVLIRPAIAQLLPHADSTVTLNCTGTPNSTNRLWLATDLTPPVAWTPVSTNVAGGDGTWQVIDPALSGSSQRFYRLSMP